MKKLLLVVFLLNSFFSLFSSVRLQLKTEELKVSRGEKVVLEFVIDNRSNDLISTAKGFWLSCHLYDQNRALIQFENQRWKIPVAVFPGKSKTFSVALFFNQPAGKYLVEWELVKEGHFWGKDRGWNSALMNLDLQELFFAELQKGFDLHFDSPLKEKLFFLIFRTLKNSEFELRKGLLAFAAGSDYPQFWLRDFASVVFAARYFYSLATLEKLVEFVLLEIEKNGLQDWYDAQKRSDLNSAAADQAASLVLAAEALFEKNKNWIKSKLGQKSVFERLEKILDDFFKERFDQTTGLIRSGYTIDWGDVSIDYADQRALYFSPGSLISYNLFYQTRMLRAMKALEQMALFLNEKELKNKWQICFFSLKEKCRQKLFIKSKNYFRIRFQKRPQLADEDRILALGGNCEAMLAGLFNPDEKKKFFSELFRRKRALNLFSLSFVLLPPYQENYFPHHLLSKPYHYQNGGLWDWIGARLLFLLYQEGYFREAEEMLSEIGKRVLADLTFWEWYDLNAKGRGAFSYTATAVELFKALFSDF